MAVDRTSNSNHTVNTSTDSDLLVVNGVITYANGAVFYDIGSNVENLAVFGNTSINVIVANNSMGMQGQVLTTNGPDTGIYWSTVSAGNTYVMTAGDGLYQNATHYYVNANTGIIANSVGTFVNADYIANIAANSATYIGNSIAAASYTNITNWISGNAATAYTNAATLAGTAYTNATSYADTKAGTAYSNATAYADTKAGTAYSNGTAYADSKAGIAYSNAITYSIADATARAATAYANAVADAASDATSKAATAYANAVANAAALYAPLAGATFTGAISAPNVTTTSNTLTIGTAAYHVANGNLGIGTASPASKLAVSGTVSAGNTSLSGSLSLSDRINQTGTVTNAAGYIQLGGQLTVGSNTQQNMFTMQSSVSLQGNGTLGSLYGLLFLPTMVTSANNVTNLYAVFARVDTDVTYTGTIGTYTAFTAATPSLAGSSPTTIVQYLAQNATATNVFGFRSLVSAGSNKWNIYAIGTANNYMAGGLGIGTTTLTQPLTVTGNADISGNIFVTNSVNAASYTVGTAFIANATGVTTTGFVQAASSVNAASYTVGTNFIANSTLVYANSVAQIANTLVGFSLSNANITANTYWKLATLPISSGGTYDHIVIDAILDDNWGSTNKTAATVLLSNRNAFTYRYQLYGSVQGKSKILAFQEADASVSVYYAAEISIGSYLSTSININKSIGATIYPNPVANTTAPTGTRVFDTANTATYIPHMSVPYSSAPSFYGQGFVLANTTTWTGTANNATNFGGLSLATVQGQISGNAATAYTNATSYADTKAGTAYANAVANAAALYQTTAGLSANVLTLSANLAMYLGNSATTGANVASWISGNAATAYTNATSYADTKAGTAYANAVANAAALYAPLAGATFTGAISAPNVTTTSNTLTIGTAAYHVANGNLGIGNTTPADKLTIGGSLYVSGNTNFVGTNNFFNTIGQFNAGIWRSTSAGPAYWMQQDGTGRSHWYWNTSGGGSPTFAAAAEDASALSLSITNSGAGGFLLHRSASGVGKIAGDAITWTNTLYVDLNTITWKGTAIAVANGSTYNIVANNSTNFGGLSLATVQGQITSNASAAYANAVATAATDASTKAGTAYTNAVATAATDASTKAGTAYTNATTFAANASNISNGTLAEPRLPYRMDQNVTTTSVVTFSNLTLTGNLYVNGTITTISANNLTITDNMIYLNNGVEANVTNVSGNGTHVIFTANNNYGPGWDVDVTGVNPASYNGTYLNIFAVNATSFTVANTNTATYTSGGLARGRSDVNPDIGFAAGYNDGTYHHTGFFRRAADNRWYVFNNYDPEPDASIYIDVTNTSFKVADLQANTMYLGNTTVYGTVNSTVYSGAANAATYLGNNSGTYANIITSIGTAYTNAIAIAANATNLSSGTVGTARLGSGTANSTTILYGNNVWAAPPVINTAAYTWSNTQTFNANVVVAGNSTAILIVGTATDGFESNSTVFGVGNSTVNTSINATSFSGTANNATNFGGSSLATIQGQITGNASAAYANAVANAAALYQTTAGLSANVLTLTSNNSTYFSGYTWASPAALGTTTANSGNFTAVNAASHTVGSNFIANVTGITTTGLINSNGTIITTTGTGRVQLGNDSGGSISMGRIDGVASTPYIDFNSGVTLIDYDARIAAGAGNGTVGAATMTISSGALTATSNTLTIGTAAYHVANGNLGLGTASPAHLLHVAGNTFITGSVGIGSSVSATATVAVSKNITGGTSATAIAQNGTIQSDVTTAARGYYNTLNVANNTTFTINNFYHYGTINGRPSALNTTINSLHGYLADSSLVSGIANYGFLGSLPASSAFTITNVSLTTNVVTITTSAAHNFWPGQNVIVAATTTTSINGSFTVLTSPSTTTFTYALVLGDIVSTADTGTVTVSTGRWNTYMLGTAPNYFAGVTVIGTTNLTNGYLAVAPTQSSAVAMSFIGGTNQSTSASPTALTISSTLTGTTAMTTSYGIQLSPTGTFATGATVSNFGGINNSPNLAGAVTPTNYWGTLSSLSFGAAALGGTVTIAATYQASAPFFNAATTTNITTYAAFRAASVANGALNTITNIYAFQGLQVTSASSNAYNLFMSGTAKNYLAGNTGIGTTLPDATLAVTGTANVSGVVTLGSTLAAGNTTITGFANVSANVYVGNATVYTYTNATSFSGTSNNSTYLNGQLGTYYAPNTALANYALLSGAAFTGAVSGITTLATGNTTITGFANVSGNTSTNNMAVATKLNVGSAVGYDFGTLAVIEIDSSQNTYVQTVIQNANSGVNASSDLVLTNDTGNDSVNYINFGINSSTYSNSLYSVVAAGDGYLYASNGALGIGTAAAKDIIFHANGTLSTDEKMRISANGNLGIGTNAPIQKLDVLGVALLHSNSTTSISPIIVQNDNTGSNTTKSVNILFSGKDTVGTTKTTGLVTTGPVDGNYIASYMAFSTRSADTVAERMRITATGNTGIGNTAPNATLAVTGTANISGAVSIGGTLTVPVINVIDASGVANASILTSVRNGSYFINSQARAPGGAYNSLVTVDDSIMVYSNGTIGYGALSIIPWAGSSGGIRLATNANNTTIGITGNTTLTGTFTHDSATGNYGSSTAAATYQLGYGATTTGVLKTINIGTGGAAGSTTNVNIGSTLSNTFVTINANTATVTGAITLTRINPRIGTVANTATITPTADASDQYNVTALGVAATIAVPSGTAVDGQKLTIRIKDNGTARALTWTTSAGGYRVVGTTLPTTTVISKTVYVGCIYNSADTFWDVIAVAQQA